MTACLVLLLLLSGVGRAGAQVSAVPVIEVGPSALAHATTAIQTTITAVENVLHTGYMILELEPFTEIGLIADFFATLAELEAIIADGQRVMWDIDSLMFQVTHLFGLDTAPDSADGLRERLAEIRRHKQGIYMYVHKILTLQRTALRTIADIQRLLGRILSFLGQKQAMQNISTQMSTLVAEEAKTAVLTAAYQQAMVTDRHEQVLVEESMERINDALMVDYPGN